VVSGTDHQPRITSHASPQKSFLFQDVPTILPTLLVNQPPPLLPDGVKIPPSFHGGLQGVKEIVLGTGEEGQGMAAAQALLGTSRLPALSVHGCPGLYMLGDTTPPPPREQRPSAAVPALAPPLARPPRVRLLPSQVSSLVLQVSSLEASAAALGGGGGVALGRIGATAVAPGQLAVGAPCLAGLDLRLCAADAPAAAFAEGAETLLGASLPELQSARALGSRPGEPNRPLRGGGGGGGEFLGDCWMTFRATLKNPGFALRKGARGGP